MPQEYPPVPWPTFARSVARVAVRPRPSERRQCVLFAQGRTGSTLFGELLDSHPQVKFAHEILRAKVPSTRLWVAGERRRFPDRVYGFHVKIYQLTEQGVSDPGRWLRRLSDDGWTVLALRRRNLLRHVLSNMTINVTGVTHDRLGRQRTKQRVDPAELVEWIGKRDGVGRQEQEILADLPHEQFVYEDDLQDSSCWAATMTRAFTFLGLEPVPVQTTLHRRNPGRLADLIDNYDEVAEAVTHAGYAEFLD
jgi:hypothetical protein